jgi:hypothetical protein
MAHNIYRSSPSLFLNIHDYGRGFSSKVIPSDPEDEEDDPNPFPYIFLNQNDNFIKPLPDSSLNDIKNW